MAIDAPESARYPGPDLLFQGDDLVIATHGRAFYILDDIRDVAPAFGGFDPRTLFAPQGHGASLDRGATIDYFLAKEADTLKIDILDAQGKVVRCFIGSVDEEKKVEKRRQAEGIDDDGGGRGPVRPPARKAGGNRYSWDLRYPGATTFEGMILWGGKAERAARGPRPISGSPDRRRRHADPALVKIERDPREIHITNADLEEQFKLASAVRDKTSEANEMVIRIRDIKKQIDDRVKAAPPLNAPGERLATQPERRRAGCLPGPEPQQSRSVEFPDQVEQPVRPRSCASSKPATPSQPIKATWCSRSFRRSWTRSNSAWIKS